jgi:hypothetical protein
MEREVNGERKVGLKNNCMNPGLVCDVKHTPWFLRISSITHPFPTTA